jgi:hypothetical protein
MPAWAMTAPALSMRDRRRAQAAPVASAQLRAKLSRANYPFRELFACAIEQFEFRI